MRNYASQVDVTETNKIVSVRRLKPAANVVVVQWFIGRRCQYDCQYCNPDWHDTTSSHWSLEQLKTAWTNLCNANSHIPEVKFVIAISGGEPTMNPELISWCKWIRDNYKDKIQWFSVATNGTKTIEYYTELSQYVNAIVFAFHSEFATEKRFFNVVEEVDKFTKENKTGRVEVLVPDESWHKERNNQYMMYLTSKKIMNRLFPLHDFNPGKQPKPIKFQNRMTFDDNSDNFI